MVTKKDLADVPLPVYEGNSYTIVKHDMALELIENALKATEFKVIKQNIYLSKNKQISEVVLTLNYSVDADTECVIRFMNSYNKQRAFRIDSALKVKESENIFMLSGSNYKRVHKGKAVSDIDETLYMKLIGLKTEFQILQDQKEALKKVVLTKNQAFILLAILFIEKDIINSEQFNYVKKEFHNSTYNYGCDTLAAFHFLMLCTLAIQKRGSQLDEKYIQQEKLHNFFVTTFKLENIAERLWAK